MNSCILQWLVLWNLTSASLSKQCHEYDQTSQLPLSSQWATLYGCQGDKWCLLHTAEFLWHPWRHFPARCWKTPVSIFSIHLLLKQMLGRVTLGLDRYMPPWCFCVASDAFHETTIKNAYPQLKLKRFSHTRIYVSLYTYLVYHMAGSTIPLAQQEIQYHFLKIKRQKNEYRTNLWCYKQILLSFWTSVSM